MTSKPKVTILLALLLSLPLVAQAGEGKIRRNSHAVKDEYIVVLHDETPRDQVPGIARRLAKESRGDLQKIWQDAVKGFFIRMTEGQARGLSHHPDVKYIEENAEMFISASVPTNVDPSCTPGPGSPCTVLDNRLWHLDQMDQKSSVGDNQYSYCETGSGVHVYVVDMGVQRAHREFGDDPNKVLTGFDASGDPAEFPAWKPCGGPFADINAADGARDPVGVRNRAHGTGVASLVNGANLGVARAAKVVPVKVASCAAYGARRINSGAFDTSYAVGEIVHNAHVNHYYKVVQGGMTGPFGSYPSSWPTDGSQITWNTVKLVYYNDTIPAPAMTMQMTIDGLNWIVGPANTNPKSPAVVTLSTYRMPGESPSSLDDAIFSILRHNTKGITVVASANNQDSNACDTTPARLSRNNPNNPNSSLTPYKVITAGGTMLRNNPDANPANGGSNVQAAEPQHDPSKPTHLARWRCHAGDSANCSQNIYTGTYTTPNPYSTDPNEQGRYVGWNLGSNGGQCVTLFAPAKNIPVANHDTATLYRDSRASGGNASGTSWSAPIVAGMVARILENNNGYTVDDVYTALMARTSPDLDPTELNPPGVTNTPNAVLRMSPVTVQPLPRFTPRQSNGTATITATATGATSYELWRVRSEFDAATYDRGGQPDLKMTTQTTGTFTFTPDSGRSYFVRAVSACGTADSTVTTVMSVSAPAGVVATASGSTVAIQWNEVTSASGYKVERKIGTNPWATAQTVTGSSTTTINDTPTVPTGVVLYRVRALQGTFESDPSTVDVAFTGMFTDDPIVTAAPFTPVKAVHMIEVRNACNALRELNSEGAVYAGGDLDPAVLRTQFIDDAHFTSLMFHLNLARAAFGMPSVGFINPPAPGGLVDDTQMANLRSAVK
ncbi:MAG TPA: S8 family serine peptidase [Thermoanaerobaculia bacterium]|jgi:hypothetical protein